MKKLLVLILSVVMITSMLAGCSSKKEESKDTTATTAPTSGPTQAAATPTQAASSGDAATANAKFKGKKIMMSLSERDQFLTSMETAAKKYADENGITLEVNDSEQDIQKQLSHIQTAVADKYDAIICNLVNTDNAQEIIKSAGNIPVVFVNRQPDLSLLQANKYVYVGSNEAEAGNYQAQYLVNYFKKAGKTDINAVILTGPLGLQATTTRTKSAKDGLKKGGINAKYVFEDTAEWDRSKAQEKFIQFLGTGKKYDCVICNNDEMALGVVEAMDMQGVDPTKTPVVGIDATTVGCESIAKGKMAFTVFQNAKAQGSKAVEAAATIVTGGTVDKEVWIPFEPVDKTNVDKYK